jgi:hypothetical protein
VPGSSDGSLEMPLATALTKAWFEITVPSIAPASTTTSNVTVATLVGVAEASARRRPGVVSSGAWIGMPSISGEAPDASGTAAPLSRVLPGT